MGHLRFDVVQGAFKKKAVAVETPAGKPSDYFGSLVFGRSNMRKYLDSHTYERLIRCVDDGVPLDAATADANNIPRKFCCAETLKSLFCRVIYNPNMCICSRGICVFCRICRQIS